MASKRDTVRTGGPTSRRTSRQHPSSRNAIPSEPLADAFEAHADAVYRVLHRLLGPDAHGLLEQACRAVWRSVAARPESISRTQLFGAACRVAADLVPADPLPRPGRVPLTPEAAAAAHAAWLQLSLPTSPGCESTAHTPWQSLGDQVVDALAELPFAHRAAILLHHDAGFVVGEVAVMVGATPEATRAMLLTALLHLRCTAGAALLRSAPADA